MVHSFPEIKKRGVCIGSPAQIDAEYTSCYEEVYRGIRFFHGSLSYWEDSAKRLFA